MIFEKLLKREWPDLVVMRLTFTNELNRIEVEKKCEVLEDGTTAIVSYEWKGKRMTIYKSKEFNHYLKMLMQDKQITVNGAVCYVVSEPYLSYNGLMVDLQSGDRVAPYDCLSLCRILKFAQPDAM